MKTTGVLVVILAALTVVASKPLLGTSLTSPLKVHLKYSQQLENMYTIEGADAACITLNPNHRFTLSHVEGESGCLQVYGLPGCAQEPVKITNRQTTVGFAIKSYIECQDY